MIYPSSNGFLIVLFVQQNRGICKVAVPVYTYAGTTGGKGGEG